MISHIIYSDEHKNIYYFVGFMWPAIDYVVNRSQTSHYWYKVAEWIENYFIHSPPPYRFCTNKYLRLCYSNNHVQIISLLYGLSCYCFFHNFGLFALLKNYFHKKKKNFFNFSYIQPKHKFFF